MSHKDKVVWIIGASSGIGKALAIQYAALGARLILTSRDEKALCEMCDMHEGGVAYSRALAADITRDDAGSLSQKALKIFGKIDVVIFSAGRSQRSLFSETSMEVYRMLMELNFFAPVAITKALLPHFQEKGGHIVAISSMAGLMGFPLRSGYAASKHALQGFFETLQTEHVIPELYITIVSPGRVNTPISMNAITGNGEDYGKMDKGQMQGIPAEECAKRIISAVESKRKQVLITRKERILWWLWWFARPLYYKIARKSSEQA